MSRDEILAQYRAAPRIEFADGLERPRTRAPRKSVREIAAKAAEASRELLSKLRERGLPERPLCQREIDGPYTGNTRRLEKRRRLRFVSRARVRVE